MKQNELLIVKIEIMPQIFVKKNYAKYAREFTSINQVIFLHNKCYTWFPILSRNCLVQINVSLH